MIKENQAENKGSLTNKHLNYGLDKSTFIPDSDRLNFDYIKGMIDTDGHIPKNDTRKGFRIVISQNHHIFLESIKTFVQREFPNLKASFYMDGNQLSFSGKNFYNFIINYQIKDYDSYYAGIVDGDGSFCTHISPSGTYWRFCLGAKKERKIKIFKSFFEYFKLKPIVWSNKGTQMFGVQKVNDLILLLERIGNKLIVKQFVGDKVLKELKLRKESLKVECIYCHNLFERKLAKGRNLKIVCDNPECRKRYHTERSRTYRLNNKQIKLDTTGIYTATSPEEMKKAYQEAWGHI